MTALRRALPCFALLLAGCDRLGLELPSQREAEGQAIGSACRHAGRALEDCYTLNPQISRAAIFAGWKEMDQYMRENELREVTPVIPPPQSEPKKKKKKSEAKSEGQDGAPVTEGKAGPEESKLADSQAPETKAAAAPGAAVAERKPVAPATRPVTGSGARLTM